MAELAMLADMHRTVYLDQVTHQLHVMAQARDSYLLFNLLMDNC